MVEWGGSQNGILQKFDDGCGEVNLLELTKRVVSNLKDPESAIAAALEFPGFGLTYASKLLRFLRPETFGALDSRIRKALFKSQLLPKIADGQSASMVRGYLEFLGLLENLKENLQVREIARPVSSLSGGNNWRPADLEMALFSWADAVSAGVEHIRK